MQVIQTLDREELYVSDSAEFGSIDVLVECRFVVFYRFLLRHGGCDDPCLTFCDDVWFITPLLS